MWSWRWAAITLGPPLLLVAGCGAVEIADRLLYTARPFDAGRWQAGDSVERMRMSGDLVRSRALIGRTKGVVGLLGPPERGGPGGEPGELMQYRLVQGHPLGFDWTEWLVIEFDPGTGRASQVTFFD